MFRDERLELKVGLFIGLGIFLMFLIVFSISDVSMMKKGYMVQVVFDYVNGITKNSPVRLAGVHVGEVREITIYRDETSGMTKVRLDAWIDENAKIEKDSVARINTLGLLGQQYLEISPGIEKTFLVPNDQIVGKNPANIGLGIEKMNGFMNSATEIMEDIRKGQGSLGKFMTDDAVYDDLEIILNRLRDGEGTIGKLLVEEDVYDNVEGFTSDIKAHPWKLLHKTREKKTEPKKQKGTEVSHR